MLAQAIDFPCHLLCFRARRPVPRILRIHRSQGSWETSPSQRATGTKVSEEIRSRRMFVGMEAQRIRKQERARCRLRMFVLVR